LNIDCYGNFKKCIHKIKGGIVGKNASARIKTRIKNKFIRAIRRVEAQELSKEQFFRDRKKSREAELDQKRA
jgi:hypothetical protein